MALPSTSSPTFRANLASLISPLRRIRPRVPFYNLTAHRRPTLWSLYRGLLKQSPSEDVSFRVRKLFRKHQNQTSPQKTVLLLQQGYKYLDAFTRAIQGDERQQAILARYSNFIALKRYKAHWNAILQDEVEWRTKMRNRPILTGAYMRPTFYNPPLPRMINQPHAISRMIRNRKDARDKRQIRLEALHESLNDLTIEKQFEESLEAETANLDKCYGGEAFFEWKKPIQNAIAEIYASNVKDIQRCNLPFPPQMLLEIKAARKERTINKTRERTRERRGEVLRCTLKRKRKGPPAHILARMTPRQRHMDKVVRSVSEVGYVGMIKRRMGFKLSRQQTWKLEYGKEENKAWLERDAEEIRKENKRRLQDYGWDVPHDSSESSNSPDTLSLDVRK